ncbi:hypothetical protein [uncultured Bacteroides sp.]|nr:hypothetical protein [uncultured Bacteroides sp.]MDE5760539.1 hypothetical protein [Bacteroides sp.]
MSNLSIDGYSAAESMQMSGCTKVQPYKLSNSNRVSRTATRHDGFVK